MSLGLVWATLISASTYTAPSSAAAAASTILPLPGRGRSGSRVHRPPVRVNARAVPLLTLILLAVITRNLLPVQRSEEHTSELQSHLNLVCRLLLEKKKVK